MVRQLGLIFLPSVKALPGCEARHVELLRREAAEFEWLEVADEAAFLERLPDASAAVVWYFKPQWEDLAPKLRFVSTPAAGRDLVVVRPDSALTVSYGAYHGKFMAETVIGMMLAFSRCIYDCVEEKDKIWPRTEMIAKTRHLRGSHAVLLGFGHIGEWVARLLKPFGVRITGVNRSNLARPDFFDNDDAVVALSELDGVLPQADHLVVILPGDRGNDNIIDARRLALLPTHAIVYNIGRGNAIDLPALVSALKDGRLGGAGLDVFPKEPLPADSPIVGCPRVIRMPHISAFGPSYMDSYFDELLSRLSGRTQ